MPAVVWLASSVHGNELSSTEAALLTSYHLLADQRDATKEVLQRLVVLIDPLGENWFENMTVVANKLGAALR